MEERRGRRFQWLIRSILPQKDPAASSSWLHRFLNSLNYLVAIVFLAAWITAFLLLKEYLSTLSLPGSVLTDLSCLGFFGGLIVAFLVAGIAGNLLHRFIQ